MGMYMIDEYMTSSAWQHERVKKILARNRKRFPSNSRTEPGHNSMNCWAYYKSHQSAPWSCVRASFSCVACGVRISNTTVMTGIQRSADVRAGISSLGPKNTTCTTNVCTALSRCTSVCMCNRNGRRASASSVNVVWKRTRYLVPSLCR